MGDGKVLDGGVGGDIPSKGPIILFDVVEGKDGVDEWRPFDMNRSPLRRSTKYESGGGGARGKSSSSLSTERVMSRVSDRLPLTEPVTSRHIRLNPFFFFSCFSEGFVKSTGSVACQIWLRRGVFNSTGCADALGS
jgi:hypothetical protein